MKTKSVPRFARPWYQWNIATLGIGLMVCMVAERTGLAPLSLAAGFATGFLTLWFVSGFIATVARWYFSPPVTTSGIQLRRWLKRFIFGIPATLGVLILYLLGCIAAYYPEHRARESLFPYVHLSLEELGASPHWFWFTPENVAASVYGPGIRGELKSLGGNRLTSVQLRSWKHWKNVEHVSILNGEISDEDLAFVLPSWSNMTSLSIENAKIKGECLRALPDNSPISFIVLKSAPVTDENLQSLNKLKNLQGIYLCDLPIDGKTLGALGQGAPIMTRFTLSLTDISLAPEAVNQLFQIKQLKHLLLLDCKVDAKAFERFDTSAEIIHLRGPYVTDEHLAPLGRQRSLEFVRLENCEITEAGIAAISQAPRLRKISFSDVHLPHSDPVNLKQICGPRCQIVELEKMEKSERETKIRYRGVLVF